MAKRRESSFERLQKGQPLNRRQKRELAARLNSADPGFEIVFRHAAGIDIGNESHYVAVPAERDEQPIREFGSWTADLERMAQWLKACGIESVVMQSTGVYWMAVYEVLQSHGFQVNLVDARGTKNLPGRKSDVQECQWLLRLHTYGLLRSCFLMNVSPGPLKAAEIIQTSGDTVAIASTAVPINRSDFDSRRGEPAPLAARTGCLTRGSGIMKSAAFGGDEKDNRDREENQDQDGRHGGGVPVIVELKRLLVNVENHQ
jgi:hypothetical protein